jgi:hypothetical protein
MSSRVACGLLLSLLLLGSPSQASSPPLEGVPGEVLLYGNTQSFEVNGMTSTQRQLECWFEVARKAPRHARAEVSLPVGLGLGNHLKLRIVNHGGRAPSPPPEAMSYFWGPAPDSEIRGSSAPPAGFLPWEMEGSLGVPNPLRTSALSSTASLVGTYGFHISYIGDSTLVMGAEQDFLPPLQVSVPALVGPAATSRGFQVSWKPVARAVGYAVSATGANAYSRSVHWESALDIAEACAREGPTKAVLDGKLLGSTQTSVLLPPRMFYGMVTVTVTAYGSDVWGVGNLPTVGWAQSTTDLEVGADH